MTARFFIPWILATLWLPSHAQPDHAGPPHPERERPPSHMRSPHAWMGLCVSKPGESTAAQIPALPEGIGFLVTSVDEGGPAEAAGLRKLDVIWKLGDQMLVNEAQMVTLLRLSSPGDEVTLSAFRGGQPFDAKLVLGEAPKRGHKFPGDLMDATMFPGDCGGPMRVVNVADKSASYQRDEGRAEVRKSGETYQVKITGPKGEVIYEGEASKSGRIHGVPKDWVRIVYALRRGLDHALEQAVNMRAPRPRVVAPADNRP